MHSHTRTDARMHALTHTHACMPAHTYTHTHTLYSRHRVNCPSVGDEHFMTVAALKGEEQVAKVRGLRPLTVYCDNH